MGTYKGKSLLKGMRIYLAGPMDFVSSRTKEMKFGWRAKISKYLAHHGVTVFDPWNKPEVKNLHEYGKEDEKNIEFRKNWSFEDTAEGAIARDRCVEEFWQTMHVDLRMVDLSDAIIAYCPTNIYSVGTVHEIVVARQQRKPVLFVSPPVHHNAFDELSTHLAEDKKGKKLIDQVMREVPIKKNSCATPSLWYMPLIGSHNFFDGFGFSKKKYRKIIDWDEKNEMDPNELQGQYSRPLLPFLDSLVNGERPKKYDRKIKKIIDDDDWLLLDTARRL
jgi:nucleoside 2-deoxyribosyltransferase